ncbi:SAC3/GANP/Nin1/mts3/eIF-3 p25 family-domain-containing protein [Fennellomyces sp. T-0311]|nr:SAC3/GANP/Nin1/mts3/eIF-3 p25 family-domain-containing protein [Fennellomyces sp. T-0311]
MAQQQDNQTQSQPWHDPWQQQQQAVPSQQQANATYTSGGYGDAGSASYSYQQYPQQVDDHSYYQNYYQYAPEGTAAAGSTTPSGTSGYQYDYNYDYSGSGYANSSAYGSYADYTQYPQQAQHVVPHATDSSSPSTQHAYNGYYYQGDSNYQQAAVTTANGAAPPPPPPPTAAPPPPREAPSYISVPAKPKPKPMMMMMSKKPGKPDISQEASSSMAQAAAAAPPPDAAEEPSQSAASSSKPPSMESWPPSLQEYVEEVFNNCLPDKRDQAENELRNLILEKHRNGTLLTTDWDDMDLPLACGSARFRKAGPKKKQVHRSQYPSGISKSSLNGVAPHRKKDNQLTSKGMNAISQAEQERRRIRLQRFQTGNRNSAVVAVTNDLDDMDITRDTIVGTSTQLEKNYFRLTSAPDPTTVRPPQVLKKTLELLKKKWREEQNYTYICDQFKSMRQDLTVQRVRDEFTVTVYEIHARIALEKGDLGEYNQCQSQLKQLYAMGIKGNVMEFTAYRILYFLHTQNWSDINSTMFDLTPEQKKNELVKHALNVRAALAMSNYHRFFKLYLAAPQMGGYLMDQFVERERVRALLILCKAYRPTLSIEFIEGELAFENKQDLFKFLSSHNACILTERKDALDTKVASINLAESSKKFNKIDIKGQL